MSEEEKNIVEYIVVCINEFSDRYGLQMKDAYLYLRDYKGIEFLQNFYDAEHLLSFDDAVDDLTFICRRNGGKL